MIAKWICLCICICLLYAESAKQHLSIIITGYTIGATKHYVSDRIDE